MSGTRLAAIGATLGLLVAGCGDDDERLSQEAFVERANAICKAGTDRIDEQFEATFDSPADFEDVEKQEVFKEAVERDIQQQLDDLRELDPPEDLEEDFDALLDEAEATLDEVREQSAEELFSTEEDPFEEANRRAAALGLDECAEDGEGEAGAGG